MQWLEGIPCKGRIYYEYVKGKPNDTIAWSDTKLVFTLFINNEAIGSFRTKESAKRYYERVK